MSREHKDSEVRKVLRSLLSDIEAMYEGGEIFAEHRHPEEFFGPFSVGKVGSAEVADVSISWPNLAISMRNAKEALCNADAEDSGQPPTATD